MSALKCPAIICSSSCEEQSGLSGRPHVSRAARIGFTFATLGTKKLRAKRYVGSENHKKVKNSVTKPPIKFLRPLFTLQLLILHERNPLPYPKMLKLRAKIKDLYYFDLNLQFHHGRSQLKCQNFNFCY